MLGCPTAPTVVPHACVARPPVTRSRRAGIGTARRDGAAARPRSSVCAARLRRRPSRRAARVFTHARWAARMSAATESAESGRGGENRGPRSRPRRARLRVRTVTRTRPPRADEHMPARPLSQAHYTRACAAGGHHQGGPPARLAGPAAAQVGRAAAARPSRLGCGVGRPRAALAQRRAPGPGRTVAAYDTRAWQIANTCTVRATRARTIHCFGCFRSGQSQSDTAQPARLRPLSRPSCILVVSSDEPARPPARTRSAMMDASRLLGPAAPPTHRHDGRGSALASPGATRRPAATPHGDAEQRHGPAPAAADPVWRGRPGAAGATRQRRISSMSWSL